MQIIKKFFIFSLFCGFLITAQANTNALAPNNANIAFWYGYASIDGFTQIPTGGIPWTATNKRPTLAELGVDNSNLYNGEVNVSWPWFTLYGMYQYNHPQGHSVLTANLISMGFKMAKGSPIKTEQEYDLLRLGISHHFKLAKHNIIIFPELEYTGLNFLYKIAVPNLHFDRYFKQATVRIGLGGIWKFHKNLSLFLAGASSIPDLTHLQVQTATARLYYQLFAQQHMKTSLFAGIAYERIRFKDAQLKPNYIRVTMWPVGEIGLNLHF